MQEIERLDLQVKKEAKGIKRKWETIKLVTSARIEGIQLASMQFS